ncbi:MAG: hypothetical protein JEZ08_16410 [Clostridiales bacterium]|nr:hypothetical protein [Clostridiales bacterium]
MSVILSTISNFINVQIRFILLLTTSSTTGLGIYPQIEAFLIDIMAGCLLLLEVFLIYSVGKLFVLWYEKRNAAYMAYLEREEEKERIEKGTAVI